MYTVFKWCINVLLVTIGNKYVTNGNTKVTVWVDRTCGYKRHRSNNI